MAELASRYELVRRLGEGGMGVVHEAIDRHLGRHVAIKMIRDALPDATARARFLREARSAAAISHPNVCLLHEVGEHDGQPFLVMELLEGEPLSVRLARERQALPQALEIVLPILSALGALHARGLVHRDLKPSNIFLTPHGVKLLDFGLAREAARDASETIPALTMPGTLSGTPRYMAPEQITGDPVDPRTDIFAAGIVLYEMVAGRLPFEGMSTVEHLSAILQRPPAPLGRPELSGLEPIVRRALERRPADRYPSADAMAADLRPLMRLSSGQVPAPPPPAARVVVLPFRMLKADEDVAFLESALPEAVTTSLASVPMLCVRSNVAALRFGPSADLARVAEELDVDHVLTGTLLRSGDRIRVTAQLVEAPGGRVRWSQTIQRTLGDLFELQDTISRQIVESLPLDASVPRGDVHDRPASPRAYELYLRANELAADTAQWARARELYEECVAEDPQFAPAWARLGRMRRVLGKYFEPDYVPAYRAAEAAFQRAFALNPDLSLAHHLYVYLEVETGRASEALIRLAQRLDRQPNQAELYAALVQAARYCGLLEASVAAHQRARMLDKQVATSVANTYLALQDFQRVLEAGPGLMNSMKALALFGAGAGVEAALVPLEEELANTEPGSQTALFCTAIRGCITGDDEAVLGACQGLVEANATYPDGEAIYMVTRMLARVGASDLALRGLGMALEAGYFPAWQFEHDRWLDPIRGLDEYRTIVARARERSLAADAAFQAAGGYRLLGIRPPSTGGR